MPGLQNSFFFCLFISFFKFSNIIQYNTKQFFMARTKQTAVRSIEGNTPRKSAVTVHRDKSRKEQAEKLATWNATYCSSSGSSTCPVPFFAPLPAEDPKLIVHELTYESSLYKHFFSTRVNGAALESEFQPRMEGATLPLPQDCTKLQRWLALLFSSKYDGNSRALNAVRAPLNISLVLDVSGSMESPFPGERGKSKLQVAREALLSIGAQLRPDDRLSVVAFNSSAYTVFPPTVSSALVSKACSNF